MTLARIGWYIWIPGTALIALSWTGHVSPQAGWVGFIIALIGAILSWIPSRAGASPAAPPPQTPSSAALDEIAKLADLRDRGAISESEFEQKKRALLDQIGNTRE